MATRILTNRRILECARNLRFTSHYPKLLNPDVESEYVYTEEPKYPPILDVSYRGTQRREREKWRENIKTMPTVQQKLLEMAELGLQFCYLAEPDTLYYNCLPAYQYATRTHLIEGLPDAYEKIDVEDAYARLKPHLIDAITTELEMHESGGKFRDKPSELVKQEKLIGSVLSVLLRGLAKDAPHLQTAQVDYRPRCDAFWEHSRYYPNQRRRYRNQDIIPMNFQFMDKPDAQIRITEPLPAIVGLEDPLVCNQEVPDFPYHPSYMKFKFKRKYLTSLPGTWPLHECNFPLLTIRQRSILTGHHESPFKTAEEVQDATNAAAILSGFGWLNGVATQLGDMLRPVYCVMSLHIKDPRMVDISGALHYGISHNRNVVFGCKLQATNSQYCSIAIRFTIYHDPSYPLVSHVVNTDGQHWTFAVYQLNTLRFHTDYYESNPLRNLCWSSGNLRLFEAYENGQLKGIDDNVFKLLLKFMLRQPKAPEGIELRPYLGVDTRPEEERQERLQWWMRTYDCRFNEKQAIAREVPMWVKIYKWHEDAPPTPNIKLK